MIVAAFTPITSWRTIKFAHHISEDEAQEILTALQANLPDVAQQICAMPDSSKKHSTTRQVHSGCRSLAQGHSDSSGV